LDTTTRIEIEHSSSEGEAAVSRVAGVDDVGFTGMGLQMELTFN